MGTADRHDIVITGMGVISPVGIGAHALRDAMVTGRSGIDLIRSFDTCSLPMRIAGEVDGFSAEDYVRPRKSLKLMSRDTQLGIAAAEMACRDACFSRGTADPDRVGVLFGADVMRHEMSEIEPSYRAAVVDGRFEMARWPTYSHRKSNPLGLLRVLPNMLPSHISIAHDARGPNNTIMMGELSSLLAIMEAAEIIRRGAADVMISGGGSSRLHPLDLARHALLGNMSQRWDDPAAASRPFDVGRDGQVRGEGAAAFILESRRHAEARGVRIRGQLLGWSSTSQPFRNGQPHCGEAIVRAIQTALRRAGLHANEIGHVNAHGLSTIEDDRVEVLALGKALPETMVTAPKSYIGNLGAAGGAVELAASVVALEYDLVPPILNHQRSDPDNRLPIVQDAPVHGAVPTCICLNQTSLGQAAAAIIVVR